MFLLRSLLLLTIPRFDRHLRSSQKLLYSINELAYKPLLQRHRIRTVFISMNVRICKCTHVYPKSKQWAWDIDYDLIKTALVLYGDKLCLRISVLLNNKSATGQSIQLHHRVLQHCHPSSSQHPVSIYLHYIMLQAKCSLTLYVITADAIEHVCIISAYFLQVKKNLILKTSI